MMYRYWAIFFFLLLSACASTEHISPPTPLPKNLDQVVFTPIWRQSFSTIQGDRHPFLEPAVANHQVFVATTDGTIAAMTLDSGKIIWKQQWPDSLLSGVSADDSVVVVTTSSGLVIALDPATGKKRWEQPLKTLAFVPPILKDGLIIVLGFSQHLIALEESTGHIRWQNPLPNTKLRLITGSVPIASKDVVFVGSPNGTISSFRLADGWQLWQQQVGQANGIDEVERLDDVGQLLAHDDQSLYASTFHGGIYALDLSTGQVNWHLAGDNWRGVQIFKHTLYAADNQGHLWAIDHSTGQVLWQQKDFPFRNWNTPILWNKLVIATDRQGILAAFSAQDGHLQSYQTVCQGSSHLSPVPTPAGLLLLCDNGRLTLLNTPN